MRRIKEPSPVGMSLLLLMLYGYLWSLIKRSSKETKSLLDARYEKLNREKLMHYWV